ncbi:MAG: hypothetical protein LBB27_00315 [Tannerellaceae bacterium]|nr:hypothetical protein [Tannerellaceae bacterium]
MELLVLFAIWYYDHRKDVKSRRRGFRDRAHEEMYLRREHFYKYGTFF